MHAINFSTRCAPRGIHKQRNFIHPPFRFRAGSPYNLTPTTSCKYRSDAFRTGRIPVAISPPFFLLANFASEQLTSHPRESPPRDSARRGNRQPYYFTRSSKSVRLRGENPVYLCCSFFSCKLVDDESVRIRNARNGNWGML